MCCYSSYTQSQVYQLNTKHILWIMKIHSCSSSGIQRHMVNVVLEMMVCHWTETKMVECTLAV